MDIDSPPSIKPSSNALILPTFSASFPLPFRVLSLVGFAILLWAINLHVLSALGIDTAWALDLGVVDTPSGIFGDIEGEADLLDPLLPPGEDGESHSMSDLSPSSTRPAVRASTRPSPATLYQPIYKLFVLYTLWVGGGWVVFRLTTGGEAAQMESWRGIFVIIVLGVGLGIGAPWKGWGGKERRALLYSLYRIFITPSTSAPFFCDVILADILTSFAKVFGDIWVSATQIWGGGVSKGRIRLEGWSNWLVLAMVCMPYILRLRQCLTEYLSPSNKSSKPLLNALKYASAFPVIFLSALQRTVVKEIAESKGLSVEELRQRGGTWFGEHRVFRLWLLAVVVNSLYSFWWDVTNDWGLSLLKPTIWSLSSRPALIPVNHGSGRSPRRPSLIQNLVAYVSPKQDPSFTFSPHQLSPYPTPGAFERRQMDFAPGEGGANGDQDVSIEMAPLPSSVSPITSPSAYPSATTTPKGFLSRPLRFGLRPVLLFPDPTVYHLFILIDFVLRVTWSLKLSSHLHTISEIESGVFLMEALELGRRWMWVFLRIEWEVVKKMEAVRTAQAREWMSQNVEGELRIKT